MNAAPRPGPRVGKPACRDASEIPPEHGASRAIPIAATLAGWKRRHPRKGKIQSLRDRWEKAAGPWARFSRPASLRAGRLKIEVVSSTILAELASLRRQEFLAAMQAAEPSVRDLSFAVGDGPWESPP